MLNANIRNKFFTKTIFLVYLTLYNTNILIN